MIMAEEKFVAFQNEKTAEEYESLIEVDQWVEVPVQEAGCNCTAFRGLISTLTPCAAKRYLEQGGNLIRRKAVPQSEGKQLS